jgi:hypothetical protein
MKINQALIVNKSPSLYLWSQLHLLWRGCCCLYGNQWLDSHLVKHKINFWMDSVTWPIGMSEIGVLLYTILNFWDNKNTFEWSSRITILIFRDSEQYYCGLVIVWSARFPVAQTAFTAAIFHQGNQKLFQVCFAGLACALFQLDADVLCNNQNHQNP